MKNILLIISIVFLLFGCETRNFQFVGNVLIYKSIHIDEDEPFNKVESIYEQDIRTYLEDVPDNAEITDVNITAIGIRLIPKPGNKAKVISMFGTLEDYKGVLPLFPEGDYMIPNSTDDVVYIPLKNIYNSATAKLLNFTKKLLLEDEFGDINVIIDGYSKNDEYDILAECEIQVQIQVLFDVQRKAPKFIADPYGG